MWRTCGSVLAVSLLWSQYSPSDAADDFARRQAERNHIPAMAVEITPGN